MCASSCTLPNVIRNSPYDFIPYIIQKQNRIGKLIIVVKPFMPQNYISFSHRGFPRIPDPSLCPGFRVKSRAQIVLFIIPYAATGYKMFPPPAKIFLICLGDCARFPSAG